MFIPSVSDQVNSFHSFFHGVFLLLYDLEVFLKIYIFARVPILRLSDISKHTELIFVFSLLEALHSRSFILLFKFALSQ